MSEEKLSKLEEATKKAEAALRKAKLELKKEREAQAKVEAEERDKWLLLIVGGLMKSAATNPGLIKDLVIKTTPHLTESEMKLVVEGLKKEGLLVEF